MPDAELDPEPGQASGVRRQASGGLAWLVRSSQAAGRATAIRLRNHRGVGDGLGP